MSCSLPGLRDGHPDGKENACLAEVEAEMEIHGNTVKDLKANNTQVSDAHLREDSPTFDARCLGGIFKPVLLSEYQGTVRQVEAELLHKASALASDFGAFQREHADCLRTLQRVASEAAHRATTSLPSSLDDDVLVRPWPT
jgi:hypothetical protein